jgi:hypothetical protein
MVDALKRRTRNPPALATLGPDDPEALLGLDFAPRTRPQTKVAVYEPGLTALQPILVQEELVEALAEAAVRKERYRANGNGQKNVVEGHQGHLRSDPIEVRLCCALPASNRLLTSLSGSSQSSSRSG